MKSTAGANPSRRNPNWRVPSFEEALERRSSFRQVLPSQPKSGTLHLVRARDPHTHTNFDLLTEFGVAARARTHSAPHNRFEIMGAQRRKANQAKQDAVNPAMAEARSRKEHDIEAMQSRAVRECSARAVP